MLYIYRSVRGVDDAESDETVRADEPREARKRGEGEGRVESGK